MSVKILLRIAAIIMLFHGVGHTIGVATWQSLDGDVYRQIPQVVKSMQDAEFSFMGKDGATMAGFYSGFGYCGTIFLVFVAALLWVLAGWKSKSLTPLLWITAGSIVALAILEIIYFFPMAVAFCLISAALVVTSIILIHKCKSNYSEIFFT